MHISWQMAPLSKAVASCRSDVLGAQAIMQGPTSALVRSLCLNNPAPTNLFLFRWQTTPMQEQLAGCLSALSLHLGSRLHSAWRTSQAQLSRPIPAMPPPVQLSEGCRWLKEQEAEIGLPDYPEFPEVFELPAVIPIPRLPGMPDWEQVQGKLQLEQQKKEIEVARHLEWWPTIALGAGVGACAAAGVAMCALATTVLVRRARSLSRPQLRFNVQSCSVLNGRQLFET